MEMRKRTIITALALLCVVAVPVFAYMYRTEKQIPTGIIVKTPTLQIGVYWDAGCTQPVTVIDLGGIPQPNYNQSISKTLWVRNEGDVGFYIYWNSTLASITDEIVEEWMTVRVWYPWGGTYTYSQPLNGTWFDPSGGAYSCMETEYQIWLSPYVSVGTYNWTLTIWGEY